MNPEKIEVGDVVNVGWPEGNVSGATVLYTPQDRGDSWRLKLSDGKILYVQQFETMLLVKKGDGK